MMRGAASNTITDDLIQKVQSGSEQMTEGKAIALAGELFSRQRHGQAANVCRQVLQHNPKNADAHNILGVCLDAMGKTKEGVAAIRRAIKLAPHASSYRANLGEVLRNHGDLADALIELIEAVRLDPRNAEAHNNLGIVRYEKKEYEQAVAAYRQALAINPRFAEAYNNLGNSLRMVPDLEGAQLAYEKALGQREVYPEAYNNLGTLLREQGKDEQAEHALRKAIAQNPSYIDAYHNLAAIYHTENKDVEALRLMADVLAFAPRNAKCLILTAQIQTRRSNYAAAEAACRIVLEDEPHSCAALTTLGMLMHETDRYEESIRCLEDALKHDPKDAEANNFYGVALKSVGRLDEARSQILRAIAQNEKMYGAYANLNDLVNFAEEDALFATIEGLMDAEEDKSAKRLLPLHYAYAKALDDRKDHAKALQHYIAGGQMKRTIVDYSEADAFQFFADIKARFPKEIFENRPYAGNADARAVFIVGMPRSGSTLVEQIISAHPDVFGAGEVKYLSKVLNGLRDRFPSLSRYPQIITEMDGGHFGLVAQKYLEQIGVAANGAAKITDKLLTNYYFVGLIHLLYPNAKIINTLRDPVDTCLSAFTKLFKDDMPHSYDLGEIGRYYMQYAALMEHWRSVLPAGVMMSVQYEDVVKDTEAAARNILEFVGLPWNDACLEFHKSSRPVKTASVAQVRKPIYTTALKRWHKYGSGLAPLLAALEMEAEAPVPA
jgi:tetratricopeptide (TPR) repeat protein